MDLVLVTDFKSLNICNKLSSTFHTALKLPFGKTTVMHLVARETLPEPNSQGKPGPRAGHLLNHRDKHSNMAVFLGQEFLGKGSFHRLWIELIKQIRHFGNGLKWKAFIIVF